VIEITAHAHRRIKSRCGKSMDRLAQIAYERGLTQSETSGALGRYIDSLYLYNGTANNIRLYGDKVYVFCNDVLVTVLDTPRKYRNIVDKAMRRRLYGTTDKG
jgi:hypothetical protein